MYVITYCFLTFLDYVLFISSNSVSTTEVYCLDFTVCWCCRLILFLKTFFYSLFFKNSKILFPSKTLQFSRNLLLLLLLLLSLILLPLNVCFPQTQLKIVLIPLGKGWYLDGRLPENNRCCKLIIAGSLPSSTKHLKVTAVVNWLYINQIELNINKWLK